MKKFLTLLVITMMIMALNLTGCAAVDYFTKAENQQNLVRMGITCFQGPDLKAGAAYIIKKDGTTITPTSSGEFMIGCDKKWFSVICDVTKGPNENPCSNVLRYDLYVDTPPVAEPAPAAEPAPVAEPAAEETKPAEPTEPAAEK